MKSPDVDSAGSPLSVARVDPQKAFGWIKMIKLENDTPEEEKSQIKEVTYFLKNDHAAFKKYLAEQS